MDRVERDPEVAALYRQARLERELMGGDTVREALSRTQAQAPEKTPEQIERERRRDLDRNL